MHTRRIIAVMLLALLAGPNAFASVLPEDRTDALYHHYTGGGVDITGPSVLIRKKVGKSVSFVTNYYVDMISSASIDVITTASPYDEERTQWSLGMDYLRGNTTMSVGYTSSDESDYDAEIALIAQQSDLPERRVRARLEKQGQMDAFMHPWLPGSRAAA